MGRYFIGIMTGTSADALDGCLVSFEDKFELICSASLTLDGSYKRDYEECIRAGYKNTNESKKLFELENILNQKIDFYDGYYDDNGLKIHLGCAYKF